MKLVAYLKNQSLSAILLAGCVVIGLIGIFSTAVALHEITNIIETTDPLLASLSKKTYALALFAVFAIFLISMFLVGYVGLPIYNLTKACHRVIQGDTRARVAVDRGGDLGFLALSFNYMLEMISRQDSNMKSLLDGLNDAVFSFGFDGRINYEKSNMTFTVFKRIRQCSTMQQFIKIYAPLNYDEVDKNWNLIWLRDKQSEFHINYQVLPQKLTFIDEFTRKKKYIKLEYRFINIEIEKQPSIIVIASDQTSQIVLQREKSIQAEKAARIVIIEKSVDNYIKFNANMQTKWMKLISLNTDLDRKLRVDYYLAESNLLKQELQKYCFLLTIESLTELEYKIHFISQNYTLQDFNSELKQTYEEYLSTQVELVKIFSLNN